MKKNNRQLSAISYQLSAKGIGLLIAFGLLFITLSAGCARKEIKNIDSKGRNVICFGDSITFGYGAEPGEDYPAELAKMTRFPVINAGIDGDTTIEALKRVDSDVLGREPLLVIIEFGGNDFLRKIPREVSLSNIRYMVDSVQAKGAMVAIVDISAGFFLKEYRQELSSLAQEKGALFIPAILSGVITNPNLKSDFIHPNREGYKVIAQRIYRAIFPVLNQYIMEKRFKK